MKLHLGPRHFADPKEEPEEEEAPPTPTITVPAEGDELAGTEGDGGSGGTNDPAKPSGGGG